MCPRAARLASLFIKLWERVAALPDTSAFIPHAFWIWLIIYKLFFIKNMSGASTVYSYHPSHGGPHLESQHLEGQHKHISSFRHTHTHTQKERERKRDRKTESERQRQTQTDIHRETISCSYTDFLTIDGHCLPCSHQVGVAVETHTAHLLSWGRVWRAFTAHGRSQYHFDLELSPTLPSIAMIKTITKTTCEAKKKIILS